MSSVPIHTSHSPARTARRLSAFAVAAIATIAAGIALPLPALAQAPAVPDPSDLGAFLKQVVSAAAAGQWKILAGLAIVALVWAIRRYGAKVWPFLATDSGGAWVVFVTGVLGAVGASLYAGQGFSWATLAVGVGLAWTAGGAWSGVRKMLRPLVPLVTRLPGVGGAVAKLLAFIAGSDLAGQVKRETDATFRATPPPGPGAAEAEANLFQPPAP
jgi:hypothetical protein